MDTKLKEVTAQLRHLHEPDCSEENLHTAVIVVYGALGDPKTNKADKTSAHVFLHTGLLTFENCKTFLLGEATKTEALLFSLVHLLHAQPANIHSSLAPASSSQLSFGSTSTTLIPNTSVSVQFIELTRKPRSDPSRGQVRQDEDGLYIDATVTAGEISSPFSLKVNKQVKCMLGPIPECTIVEDHVRERLGLTGNQNQAENQEPRTKKKESNHVVICKIEVHSMLESSFSNGAIKVTFRDDMCCLDTVIAALGNSENIHLSNFSHADPFTKIKVVTQVVECSRLASGLRKVRPNDACDQAAPTLTHHFLDRREAKSSKSLAVFKYHNSREGSLELFAKCNFKKAFEWFQISRSESSDGQESQMDRSSSGYSRTSDCYGVLSDSSNQKSFLEFMNEFVKPFCPRSFKLATSQLEFRTLAPPTNMGTSNACGQLYMKTDDEAHMIHCKLRCQERQIKRVHVEKYFAFCLKIPKMPILLSRSDFRIISDLSALNNV